MNKYTIVLILITAAALLFRIWNIENAPPSLYWDEVSQAFNAYSILETGRDEHQEFLPIARFQAFGDYKAPVYIYSLVPSIALFGKSLFAVRLPSILYGTFTVLITYFLVKELFYNSKKRELLAIVSSFLLSISPWHIQLSRGAYEGNAAVFYSVLGVWLFFRAKRQNPWLMMASAISLVVSFYAFNGFRLFIPLIVILFAVLYYKQLLNIKKQVIAAAIIGIILLIPFVQFMMTPESSLRFQEVNIFSDVSLIEESNQWREYDQNSTLSNILHNRRVLYALSYIEHYLDFFDPTYLFISGDENPRFSSQDVGQLYIWMLPVLLIGWYQLFTKQSRSGLFVIIWFLIAPLAAATARETPHALRSAAYIPTYQIIGSIGIVALFSWIKNKSLIVYKLTLVGAVLIVVLSIVYFLHNYHTHFPRDYGHRWQYGYQDVISYTERVKDQYDTILFTTAYGRPHIYVAYYSDITPQEYWNRVETEKDQYGFFNVYSLGKYQFVSGMPQELDGSVLYVTAPGETWAGETVLEAISFLNGETAFILSTNNEE